MHRSRVIIHEATDAQAPAKTSPGAAAGSSGEVIVLFKDSLVLLKNQKGIIVRGSFLSRRVSEVLINDLHGFFPAIFAAFFATC